jgi:hypothetical protein
LLTEPERLVVNTGPLIALGRMDATAVHCVGTGGAQESPQVERRWRLPADTRSDILAVTARAIRHNKISLYRV